MDAPVARIGEKLVRRLFPVPDAMPLATAALAEPLAVGMQAVNQSEAVPGET